MGKRFLSRANYSCYLWIAGLVVPYEDLNIDKDVCVDVYKDSVVDVDRDCVVDVDNGCVVDVYNGCVDI